MHSKLAAQIATVESLIPHMAKQNNAVSAATVGWHIDHLLLVFISTFKVLIKSDPTAYKWQFNRNRSLLKVSNKIPRGKVRAPKAVINNNEVNEADLLEAIKNAKSILERGKTLDKNANMPHPFLGPLNLKNAFWFLGLHNQHHMHIIEDILKANSKP
ncbi:DUF1569 domain-containing protein [Putridiphycobacter roseus]|uniref:DUF1569 domain-containing protein n=1 Tax=Putridiphycobacter roseus TaxID=2219161 RepID=A0A2W1MX70_9FLAO|nr:DinB family protein [Putridiphycobacter roseus]PZE15954.1 DUF1569 domain-containing protein [Putridiphycobacter roseus]